MPSQFTATELQKLYRAYKKKQIKKVKAEIVEVDVPIVFDETDILGPDELYVSNIVGIESNVE